MMLRELGLVSLCQWLIKEWIRGQSEYQTRGTGDWIMW